MHVTGVLLSRWLLIFVFADICLRKVVHDIVSRAVHALMDSCSGMSSTTTVYMEGRHFDLDRRVVYRARGSSCICHWIFVS